MDRPIPSRESGKFQRSLAPVLTGEGGAGLHIDTQQPLDRVRAARASPLRASPARGAMRLSATCLVPTELRAPPSLDFSGEQPLRTEINSPTPTRHHRHDNPRPERASLHAPFPPEFSAMHLRELKQKPMADLVQRAKELNIAGAAGLRKQELIFALLQAHAAQDQPVFGEGVLECLPDGFGFLRAPDYNYL